MSEVPSLKLFADRFFSRARDTSGFLILHMTALAPLRILTITALSKIFLRGDGEDEFFLAFGTNQNARFRSRIHSSPSLPYAASSLITT